MSLANFSAPYLATPPPPLQPYYAPAPAQQPPLLPEGPYSYPPPANPFLREEYLPSTHQQQQPQQQQIPHSDTQQQRENQSGATRPPTYTRVQGGGGSKTRVHAVIDYDGDYYDDGSAEENGEGRATQPVAPIQGPILLKNGSVPVVPLYSYPVLNNGSFVQIPILWTALSVALGLELRGEYIKGVPCIKKNQQLYCPTAGSTYPLDRIELFIDENKALMKRMYGEFNMEPADSGGTGSRRRRRDSAPGVPDLHADPGGGSSFFASHLRSPRQSFRNNQSSETGRVDACESKVEIVTPYWAANAAGKIRAIVNTQHFEQAIHQEVCSKVRTNRCSGDCGCEQKYKWHRLLAFDPDNDCKGIFMDWFLFPSCCVCRCKPT